SGAYMSTMTYREYLGHLLSITGASLLRRQQTEKGMDFLAKGLKLYPRDAMGHANMADALLAMATAGWSGGGELRSKAAHHKKRAEDLGFVDQAEVFQSQKIR